VQRHYFVADAYYAARMIVTGLLKENNHLVTRVKSNAVAYTTHQQRGPRKRGRPRVYGRKVQLSSLLQGPKGRQQAKSPVYGERQVVIQYKVRDLLWRPAGRLVRFVAVIHPTRGSCLLMCTDTSLAAIEIAAHHPARNPALGAGRGQCPAPRPAGISLESRRRQHRREIRHRTTGHR
jgi:hypothetical protein